MGSNPQDRFGAGLIGTLAIEFDIGCIGIFLLAGTVWALRQKMFQ
jgi:hypothetical protein